MQITPIGMQTPCAPLLVLHTWTRAWGAPETGLPVSTLVGGTGLIGPREWKWKGAYWGTGDMAQTAAWKKVRTDPQSPSPDRGLSANGSPTKAPADAVTRCRLPGPGLFLLLELKGRRPRRPSSPPSPVRSLSGETVTADGHQGRTANTEGETQTHGVGGVRSPWPRGRDADVACPCGYMAPCTKFASHHRV